MDQTNDGIGQILSIDEIVQVMLYLTDLDRLIVLYPSMKHLIDTPASLEVLSQRFDVPYQITDYTRGVMTQKVLIKSLPDLVFALQLRDPEERKKSCLSPDKILEIAIMEDNLKLVNELLAEGVNPEYEGNYRKAGYRGNKQVIDVLLADGHEEYIEEVLYGLAKNHHNALLKEYIDEMDFDEIEIDRVFCGVSKGASIGDNLEVFVKYRSYFQCWIDIVRRAAKGKSRKILDLLYAYPALEIIKNDHMMAELFDGFLSGGHLEEAKKIYEKIENKSLIGNLSYLVESKCIECFLFAEEIGQITRSRVIYYLGSLMKLKDVTWFIVTRDDSLWEIAFDTLLSSEDTSGLIRLYQHFNPKFINVKYLLEHLNQQSHANKCFATWLQTHKPLVE